jgi:hypothetical protein
MHSRGVRSIKRNVRLFERIGENIADIQAFVIENIVDVVVNDVGVDRSEE